MAKRPLKRRRHKDRVYTEVEAYSLIAKELANLPVANPGYEGIHPHLDPQTWQAVQKHQAEQALDALREAVDALGQALVTVSEQQVALHERLQACEATSAWLQAFLQSMGVSNGPA